MSDYTEEQLKAIGLLETVALNAVSHAGMANWRIEEARESIHDAFAELKRKEPVFVRGQVVFAANDQDGGVGYREVETPARFLSAYPLSRHLTPEEVGPGYVTREEYDKLRKAATSYAALKANQPL